MYFYKMVPGHFIAISVFIVTVGAPVFAETTTTSQTESPGFVKDGELDLDAAVYWFEDLYRANSSIADVEMTITRPRRTHAMRMQVWTEGTEQALVVIQSPPREKGMSTLKVDKNLWNYMPRIKRTVRVPPSMMLTSWMGSDFTNDDLVREASMTDDYDYETVGPSDDPPGWRVRFTAKPDTVGLWSKIELVLSENGTLPVQAEYFDRRERLSRTIYWDEVKTLDGRELPTKMTLIPEDEEDNKTIMQYHEIDFDVDLSADLFSLSRLEQGR